MEQDMQKNILHLIVLGILLLSLLGALIFTGFIGCSLIPGGCEIYYLILRGGEPQVLVVYTGEGMGDADALTNILQDREFIGTRADKMEIERISWGNVNDYDLIIVTNAKQICSSKLSIFQHYVNSGGRLVWTGDAGTELCPGDQLLLESQRVESGEEKAIGPWARNQWGQQLSFDEFLGVNYKANYCEISECDSKDATGFIQITDNEHKLTYGLSPSISYHGDIALVKVNNSLSPRLVAVLDYGIDLLGENEKEWLGEGTQNFGKNLPLIVTTGPGERVTYYSIPLENLLSEEQPQKYKALIEQMYYGMLFK